MKNFKNWIAKVGNDERLVRFFQTCERLNYYNENVFEKLYQLHIKWNQMCIRLETEKDNPKVEVLPNSVNPILEEISNTLNTMSYRQFKELCNQYDRRNNS